MILEIIQKEKRKFYLVSTALMISCMILLFVSITLGEADITFADTYQVLINKLFGQQTSSIFEAIVWDIRLPRILTGFLVGAGLSVAGVIFQSILRNPLADPYTIGVSTGAAFGAVLTIYLNLVWGLYIPIMPVAFVTALLTLYIIMRIAGFGNVLHSSRLILAGIIVSAILSAGISLLKSMAGEDVSAMVFWLMGRLSAKSWLDVLILLPCVLIGIIVAQKYAHDLDVLTLGAHEARNIGIHTERRMKMYLIIGALLTAVCVSVSGVIGFVGLVIPHVIRMGFSAKHKYLIPLSALLGGLILALADNFSRLLFAVEIPVGVLTTLIGGPFFIAIYMKKKGNEIL